jgi:hypothetical protein
MRKFVAAIPVKTAYHSRPRARQALDMRTGAAFELRPCLPEGFQAPRRLMGRQAPPDR